MKFKDIEKAMGTGTDYAIANWGSRRDSEPHDRGIVIETKVKRQVYTGRRADWGGHAAYDGVVVRLYDKNVDAGCHLLEILDADVE